MKILYDYQAFSMQRVGGISKYFYYLLKGFPDRKLAIKYCNNIYLRSENDLYRHPATKYYDYNTFMEGREFIGKGKLFLLSSFFGLAKSYDEANLEHAKKEIRNNEFDLFHPTYYDPYFLKSLKGKPFVLTIHDMIHEIFPELFPKQTWLTAYKKLLAQKASRIIVVSENTKKDLLNFFNVEEDKIDVIYHGINYPMQISKPKKSYFQENKFLLFVGNRDGYKNFKLLIESFSLLVKEGFQGNLVCVGGGEFSYEEYNLLKKKKLESSLFRYNVGENELNYFYSNAACLICPSLYEGFGMPIIEAGALGCPLLLSDITVFKEIASKRSLFFDPHNPLDLKNKIVEIISYPKKYSDKEFYLKNYSWNKTVAETKKSYGKVLEVS